MRDILILTDDRGFFYSSTRERGGSLDVQKLKDNLKSYGYDVEVKRFYEIDFHNSYKGKIVLYQSTEDPGLKYKDYIEDILLGLERSGAILIPDFDKFRAHHNKVYMEILRESYGLNRDTNIYSKKYGTLEEFIENIENHVFPVVIKPSAGSRSIGVSKANNSREAIKEIKKISKTHSLTNLKRSFKSLFDGRGYKPISNYRNKFIVQNLIPELSGDYKVLIYGNRYYILQRENRKKDFRASGSGNFSFLEKPINDVLDFAENTFNQLNTPFVSFDIAMKDRKLILTEFQFVSFGQYALEKSKHYFVKKEGLWRRVDQTSDLEKVFSDSIHNYLQTSILNV